MWFGSFQIVQVDTLGSGAASAAAGFAAEFELEPDELVEPDPEPEPLELPSTLKGNPLSPVEPARWNEAVCEPKTEWIRSESPECAWSAGGALPYFGTNEPE